MGKRDVPGHVVPGVGPALCSKGKGSARWVRMVGFTMALVCGCSDLDDQYDLTGRQKKRDQESMRNGIILQWMRATQSCTVNGSINTNPAYIFNECIATSLTSGFVYDSTAAAWLTVPAVVGTNGLECHSSQTTGPETVCGSWWYMFAGTNPPAGAAVSAVFRHACVFDSNYNVVSVNQFTNYAVGNTYFCVPGGSAYGKYQIVVPQ